MHGSSLLRPSHHHNYHGYLLCEWEEQHQGTAWLRDGGQLITLQPHHVHEATALIHAEAFHQLETYRQKKTFASVMKYHVVFCFFLLF